ncbi:MAG: hypothetical protein UZ22_OP11002000981 [Microgenomates bacterium OLB23]|nr:MAG: hypothetical protein UZ22_OP11002000981 [Microgenomates bacterium OLB23]
MYLVTEEQPNALEILCVRTKRTFFSDALEQRMEQFGATITINKELPDSLAAFTYIYVFYDTQMGRSFFKRLNALRKKIIVISYDSAIFEKINALVRSEHYEHFKFVNVEDTEGASEYVEKVVWFASTRSKEKGLNLEKSLKPKQAAETQKSVFQLPHMTKSRWIGLIIGIIFIIETFFVVPLGVAGYYLYRAGTALENQKPVAAQKFLRRGRPFVQLSEQAYAVARPLLSFFFITLLPENFIQTTKNGYEFTETVLIAKDTARQLFTLLLKVQKTPEEEAATSTMLSNMRTYVETLYRTSGSIKDTLTFEIEPLKKNSRSI